MQYLISLCHSSLTSSSSIQPYLMQTSCGLVEAHHSTSQRKVCDARGLSNNQPSFQKFSSRSHSEKPLKHIKQSQPFSRLGKPLGTKRIPHCHPRSPHLYESSESLRTCPVALLIVVCTISLLPETHQLIIPRGCLVNVV